MPNSLVKLREGGDLADVYGNAPTPGPASAGIKKFADARQPLDQTLTMTNNASAGPSSAVLKEMQARVEHRRMEMQDEDEDEN